MRAMLLLMLFSSLSFAETDNSIIELPVYKFMPDVTNVKLVTGKETVILQFDSNTTAASFDTTIVRDLPEIPFGITSNKELEKMAGQNAKNFVVAGTCVAVGLDEDCRKTFELSGFVLPPGDGLRISATFLAETQESDGNGGQVTKRETLTKTYQLMRLPKGQFRFGVGTFFVLSGEDDYFTRAVDGGFEIASGSGDSAKLNLTATATWLPNNYIKDSQWAHGPTIGIGTDANDVSVFLGWSLIFQRAWTITAGVAGVQESELISRYEVGQVVMEQLDADSLVKDSYQARPFIGLSWSPKAD